MRLRICYCFTFYLYVFVTQDLAVGGSGGGGLWRRIPVGSHSFHKSLLSTYHARFCARNGSLALIPSNSAPDSASSHCRTIHVQDTDHREVSVGISGDVLPFVGVMNGCGGPCVLPTQPPALFSFLLLGTQFCSVVYFPAGDSGEGSSDVPAPALISSREMIVRFSGSVGVKHNHY